MIVLLENISRHVNASNIPEEDANNGINIKKYFPIKNDAMLQELNIKVEENEFKKALCQFLRKLRPLNNKLSIKHLSRIITDNCLIKFNWQGTHNKQPLKDNILFKEIIYNAWFTNTPKDTYIKEMQNQIRAAHIRFSKNKKKKLKSNIYKQYL